MSDQPTHDTEFQSEIIVTIPTQALETAMTPLMNQTLTHTMEDFTPAAIGRTDALPCTRRHAWHPRALVVVSSAQDEGEEE